MISGFILESAYYFLISEQRKKIDITARLKLSITYLLIDFLLLSFFIYMEVVDIIKPENLDERHLLVFAMIYIGWIISAATTHKFQPLAVAKTKWDGVGLQVKFYMLIISLVFLSVYFLHIGSPEWAYFIKAVLKYVIVSGLLAFLLFAEKIRSKTDEATTLFLKAYELKEAPIAFINGETIRKYGFTNNQDSESVVRHKMQFEYLKEYEDVFNFIERKLDLKSFDIRKTLITRSVDTYNINVLAPQSQQLIVNLHVINDQRKINNYLSNMNSKLTIGGVFVGAMMANKNRYIRFLTKYPFLIANLLYFFDFIWKRAIPKLPLVKKIYFLLSGGKDRAISLAEGLGRLVFCGFEILDLTEINNQVFFTAVKVKEPTFENNPYYSPIFKMKRVGEGGKTIYVYKLRTMHPYSELIQNFVYINNKIQEGGKFKDDFRIPAWGKFFRSVWIDELPMIYNFLKRDIKLVGVRPISNHYFSLYSPAHQNLRKQFKPGLVPPYYADMPKTIEEIEDSEAAYLEAYKKKPFKTDVKYFLKALNNILLKEKRSG
jgi:lipopolysaccharide/colanic/teichoic acid biosynthesis glycosyltransferase